MNPTPYGLRVVGHRAGARRLIDHAAAFSACARCDPRADIDRESYLMHFQFPGAFREHFEPECSEKGYNGPCGASVLYWDIDRADDLQAALSDARRLGAFILDRYREFDDDDLLIFWSGGRGFHLGLPAVWSPVPSARFHDVAKVFCLTLAESAGVTVDPAIYSKTRLFRAPNSRHPKTGLHKRRLAYDELMHLALDSILERARKPEPFDVPTGPERSPQAAADWGQAALSIDRKADARRRATGQPSKLSAFARRFIQDGEMDADQRAVSTFRVAAELSEVYHANGIGPLITALIEEQALDSGLTPSEVAKQIRDGIAHVQRQQEGGVTNPDTEQTAITEHDRPDSDTGDLRS